MDKLQQLNEIGEQKKTTAETYQQFQNFVVQLSILKECTLNEKRKRNMHLSCPTNPNSYFQNHGSVKQTQPQVEQNTCIFS